MTIKVIQWGPGAVGRLCLEEILDHPDLELVGVFCYSAAKNGMDAGDLIGRPKTGITTTNRIEDILALEADVVLHTPRYQIDCSAEDRHVIRLLESGKNVISVLDYVHPWSVGEQYCQRLEDACRTGGATLFGAGLNPGFLAERLVPAATSICSRIEAIRIRENYDGKDHAGVSMAGIGRPPQEFSGGPIQMALDHTYLQVLHLLAEQLGVVLERVEPRHSVVVASADDACIDGPIARGTIAGIDWRWLGWADGKAFIDLGLRWIAADNIAEPGWQRQRNDHWSVDICGTPGIHLELDLLAPAGVHQPGVPDGPLKLNHGVANAALRAIPEVLAAPPGIMKPRIFACYNRRYCRG